MCIAFYEPMSQNKICLDSNISLVNLYYLNKFQHAIDIKVNAITLLIFKLVGHNFMCIYSNTSKVSISLKFLSSFYHQVPFSTIK